MDQEGEVAAFQPVKSADRTLDVLEALAARGSAASLGELARELAIPKSSLHGILRTLHQRGWVDVDPSGSRFRLGLQALQMGMSFVEADDAVLRTQATLDWLAGQSGETVQLARLDGAEVVYLAKRGSRHPLQLISTVGSRLPAHATALGKAMLATKPAEEILRLLPDRLTRLTPHTIANRRRLLTELRAIAARGYATDDEEAAEGLRCCAVAVRTGGGTLDAISFSVPTFRLDAALQSRLIDLLQQGRQRIEVGGGSRDMVSSGAGGRGDLTR